REARAEDADARQLAVRRERADDSGAGRSVPAEVAFRVRRDDGLVVFAERHGDRILDLTDERMVRVDTAVQDAYPDALAGRAAPRPLPGDLARPLDGERDLRAGSCGQAPGGPELLRWRLLLVGVRLGHAWIVRRSVRCGERALRCVRGSLDERLDVTHPRVVRGCAEVRPDELRRHAGAALGEVRRGG